MRRRRGVAKGRAGPEVSVVGVLQAETALQHPDFRASGRGFTLSAQVAGRAGRSARGGRVVVQTWIPEHPAIQAAVEPAAVDFLYYVADGRGGHIFNKNLKDHQKATRALRLGQGR